jgi:1-acyl-sn-glycerol-3-phosphate acyltransferase
MKKILFILYQPYKWLIFAPILAISTLFFGFLATFLTFFINPKIVSLIGVIWSRMCSYLTPMFVKVIGRENIDSNQSYIIASNHQSHYDVFVLYGWLGIDFKWVMKQELRKIPALGIACDKIGHIYIDRSNREAALASLNAAKDRLVNGTSALFFPEGTRSRMDEMLEFKKGAFKMAITVNLPILPITIIGTRKVLPADTLNLFPGRAKMIIHKPVDVSGYNDGNIQELMEKVKNIIKSGFDMQYDDQ